MAKNSILAAILVSLIAIGTLGTLTGYFIYTPGSFTATSDGSLLPQDNTMAFSVIILAVLTMGYGLGKDFK